MPRKRVLKRNFRSVKSPEGRNYTTNFRVTEKDLELIQMLKDMQENQ